jgi:hypothetical protein
MGTLTVDNIIVADTFLEVVPEPSVVSLMALGGLLGLVALRRRKG